MKQSEDFNRVSIVEGGFLVVVSHGEGTTFVTVGWLDASYPDNLVVMPADELTRLISILGTAKRVADTFDLGGMDGEVPF